MSFKNRAQKKRRENKKIKGSKVVTITGYSAGDLDSSVPVRN